MMLTCLVKDINTIYLFILVHRYNSLSYASSKRRYFLLYYLNNKKLIHFLNNIIHKIYFYQNKQNVNYLESL